MLSHHEKKCPFTEKNQQGDLVNGLGQTTMKQQGKYKLMDDVGKSNSCF